MDKPKECVSTLEEDVQSWSFEQARDNVQDDKAFGNDCMHRPWKAKATAG
jgi:hypothetical protein